MTKSFMHSVAAAALIMAAPAAFAQTHQSNREMAQGGADQGSTQEHRGAAGSSDQSTANQSPSDQDTSNQGTSENGPHAQHKNHRAAESREPSEQNGTPQSGAAESSKKGTADMSRQERQRQGAHAQTKGGERNNAAAQAPSSHNANAQQNGAQERGPNRAANGTSGEHAQGTAATGRGNAKIDPANAKRIREAVRNEHVENITHADFAVNVGGVVPAHYHFNPLPEDIVSIVPEYRGYDYLVVNDEIVIIEPETRRIVYTLPENQTAYYDRRSTDCR